MKYTYSDMITDIEFIAENYKNAEIFSIGESVEGRRIYTIRLGNGRKRILVISSHDALEYITSAVIMKYAKNLFRTYSLTTHDPFDFSIKRLFENVSIYFIPMINPDGVELCVNGYDMQNPYHRAIFENIHLVNPSSEWRANINGVDLSYNYDAGWKKICPKPAPSKYGGEYPESEPETSAVVKFTRAVGFDMALELGTAGEGIYYDFCGLVAPRSLETAQILANSIGYKLSVPNNTTSFGSFKDWFLSEFGREAFLVKSGVGKNPMPLSMLSAVYPDFRKIINAAVSCV